jgi:hypothetical protein
MIHPTYKRVLRLAHQLPYEDQKRLIVSLETETNPKTRTKTVSIRLHEKGDPFLMLANAWAEMGDEALSAFDAEIRRQRQEAPRPFPLETDA